MYHRSLQRNQTTFTACAHGSVGQDDAIRQIIDRYQTFVAGMSSSGKPVGGLLFLGPAGSGKTRTVEAVAESLTGPSNTAILA